MFSKNFNLRRGSALGIIVIILFLQAAAGAQGSNGSSETGVTYTQNVPFATESIAQVIANESKQPATEQRVIPFHKAPEPKVLKQGMKQGAVPLKSLSAVKNELLQSLAPVLGSSFTGLNQTGNLLPPDTMGAAGPSHLMEILNDRVGFFNKSTGAFTSVTLQGFWAPLDTNPGQPATNSFDPKVLYDQHSGRFIAVTLGGQSSPNSWLMIAISNTSDPTGTWSMWAIDADKNGAVQTNNFADFPGLGVDANNVYVTANMFDNTNVFQYGKVWVVNKTQLLNGTITWTEFSNATGSGSTMQPAHVFGSTSAEYLIDEGYYDSGTPPSRFLNINSITFPGGTPTWTNLGFIQVSSYPISNFLPDAPQLGGSGTGIATNDARLLNAVFRDGFLWTTHTVSNNANTKTEVAWYQINPANASPSSPGTPAQEGRISDASRWYYFPSIAVNSVGDVGIGFSGSNETEFAGAFYTARNASDAPGTMQSVGLLKAGLASYSVGCLGCPRWGDYSATVVDPIADTTFWTVQEYAGNSNHWGTWWGKFALRTSYGANLAVDSAALTTREGINATYNLTITNNGTTTDSDNLTVDNPDNASVVALSITDNITLDTSTFRVLALNVTNTTPGTFRVNVTARSSNDSTKFMFINTTTTVVNFSVNLTVSTTTLSTPAGTNASYTIFLQNNGTGDDSYTLAVDNPDNAARANLSVASLFVSHGATRNLTLNVTNSAGGTFHVNVTAISSNDTTKAMSINTTTTVTAVRAVNLIVASTAKTTNAGANATYTLTLQNNGTDPDSYNLTIDNPDHASVAALNPGGNITLAANATQTLLLNVTNTTSGIFRVNVTAMSTNDSSKVMSINTTTIVPIVITITNPAGGSFNDTGSVNVTAILDANGTAIFLNWNGVNITMMPNSSQPAGTVFFSSMTGLLSGDYSFRVYANDSKGLINVSETRIITVNRTNITNISAFIDPVTGNVNQTVNISSPSGNATVTIFNGTNATLNGAPITNITTDSLNLLNSTFVANLSGSDRLIGENLSLGPEGSHFSPDIQIRFNYTDEELAAAGISESHLSVKFYDTTTNTWVTQATYSQNTTGNYTIVNVSHFSTFALVGTVASGGNNPGSSSGGGGGGGGGGPSGENYSNILVKENYDLYIAKDVVTSYAFTNNSSPIKFVNITGNTSAGIINVAVETLRNTSTLVKTPALGTVYKNINIWVGTTGFAVPHNIKEAIIAFRVENSWLGSNAGSDLKMLRWDGSQWTQLETAQTAKDDKYTYYEAKTDHFSPFAISVLKSGITVPTATPMITETQPAQTAAPTATRKIAGFEGLLVIATFLAIYVRLRRRD